MALLSPQHASTGFPFGLAVGSTAPPTHSCVTFADHPGYRLSDPWPLPSRRPSEIPAKRPREHLPILPRSHLSAVYNSMREEPLFSSGETWVNRGQGHT